FCTKPEARRHTVLEHLEDHITLTGCKPMALLFIMMGVVSVSMSVVMMMVSATEQPRAGDVDGKAEDRNRYRFGEMDRNRGKEAADRFIADQQRDHRQDNSAGEPG
ncbi:hypothetical protein IXO812_20595, partial [Xanthomonas oryzae pv. oryzae]